MIIDPLQQLLQQISAGGTYLSDQLAGGINAAVDATGRGLRSTYRFPDYYERTPQGVVGRFRKPGDDPTGAAALAEALGIPVQAQQAPPTAQPLQPQPQPQPQGMASVPGSPAGMTADEALAAIESIRRGQEARPPGNPNGMTFPPNIGIAGARAQAESRLARALGLTNEAPAQPKTTLGPASEPTPEEAMIARREALMGTGKYVPGQRVGPGRSFTDDEGTTYSAVAGRTEEYDPRNRSMVARGSNGGIALIGPQRARISAMERALEGRAQAGDVEGANELRGRIEQEESALADRYANQRLRAADMKNRMLARRLGIDVERNENPLTAEGLAQERQSLRTQGRNQNIARQDAARQQQALGNLLGSVPPSARAELIKTLIEGEQAGKMTPYQEAMVGIEKEKLGLEGRKFDAEKTMGEEALRAPGLAAAVGDKKGAERAAAALTWAYANFKTPEDAYRALANGGITAADLKAMEQAGYTLTNPMGRKIYELMGVTAPPMKGDVPPQPRRSSAWNLIGLGF